MTLQRRLLWLLLLSAPAVWIAGALIDRVRARHEINELFDTQQVRLAQQTMMLIAALPAGTTARPAPQPPLPSPPGGQAQTGRLSIAAWTPAGEPLLAAADGVRLPLLADHSGFVDQRIDGQDWRTYYLRGEQGVVAVAHLVHERRELVNALIAGELLPWLLTLPVLLLVMVAAVRTALAPLRRLAGGLQQRPAADLRPLPEERLPEDLLPLVRALNSLLDRIGESVEQERRFTADAAHELRTPLAALRAQWDASQAAARAAGHETSPSELKIGLGLQRLARLVSQMLALARVDRPGASAASATLDWPRIVETTFSDLLPMAEARHLELACEWPPEGAAAWPSVGDEDLLLIMLRNLLDNAIRHAPEHSTVSLRLSGDSIEVCDAGPGVPEAHAKRLGDRFFRVPGQQDTGSGLGLSIVRRAADLHGMQLRFVSGDGFRARLQAAHPPASR